jgi:hypothetical protein
MAGLDEHKMAYPDIGPMGPTTDGLVVQIERANKPGGFYNPELDIISLGGAYGNDPTRARSILLHELQHAIQKRERFDPGANSSFYKDNLHPDVRSSISSDAEVIRDALSIQQLQSMFPDMSREEIAAAFPDEFGKELLPAAWGRVGDDPQLLSLRLGSLEEELDANPDRVEQYMRNMGEVEARNVERRADWGMNQRRDTLPSQSEDRPRSKQTPSPFAGGGKVVGPLRALSDKLGDVGEGFVSALERAIATSRQQKMPAEQWQRYLAPGRKTLVEDVPFVLKQDELDYSNLPGLLQADPAAPRTAAELLEHLKSRNLPEFDERRGASAEINFERMVDDDGWRMAADQLADNVNEAYGVDDGDGRNILKLVNTALSNTADPAQRRAAYEELLDNGYEDETTEIRRILSGGKGTAATQYEDYTTRGPTLGYEENLTKWDARQRDPELNAQYNKLRTEMNGIVRIFNDAPEMTAEEYNALVAKRDRVQEQMAPLARRLNEIDNSGFYSGHFDEGGEGLLAHSRASRRAPGVRLIEEIQSDWHQQGRDNGYKGEVGLSPEESLELDLLRRKDSTAPNTLTPDETRRIHELNGRELDGTQAVPKAPYAKTYPELEFRKQLLRAIAEGDEYLAWTPGDEQISRYAGGLRRAMDELHWTRGDDGKLSVVPMRRSKEPGGPPVPLGQFDERMQDLDEKGLQNLLGKEMARQILESADPSGKITGDNLTVGGSGMRHFYDSVVPDIARKIAKAYEGEITELPIPGQELDFRVNRNDEFVELLNIGMTREQARAELRNRHLPKFPALRITPAMREKVRRIGVPLFGGAPAIPIADIDFDGDGADYDYGRAVSRGITPDDTGHWPSRSELEDDEADALGLPWGSGVLLKGRGHETWPLTEQGESEAGYRIIKKGRRYFSVPVDTDARGDEE